MQRRIEWIDLVKATSVLLVVFMHASGTLLDLAGPGTVPMALQHFNHAVEPLRMPIFFLVSGMLAASAIHRPWRATTSRTLGMVYLYVLWMVGLMGFKLFFGVTSPEPVSSVIFAKSGFWYLYAMALFFVIAKLLRHQPAWLVVAIALLPNLLRPLTQQYFDAVIPGSLATSIAMNLAFFLFGAYFTDVVTSAAHRITWPVTLTFGVAAVAASLHWLDDPQTVGQTYFGLSVLWVGFGVSLAVQLSRNGTPKWARHVSARTLSVYMLQWPVIFLLFEFWPHSTVDSVPAQVLFPLLITATVAWLAMWMQDRPSLWWMFKAPAWVTGPWTPQVPAPSVAEPVPVTAATR